MPDQPGTPSPVRAEVAVEDKAMHVVFGALSPSIAEQLGVTGPKWAAFDKDAKAIVRLKVRGILTDREAHAARKRLMRRICEEIPTEAL